MKLAHLEKENMKLKRQGLKKKGVFFLPAYLLVAEIFEGINHDEVEDKAEFESEELFEDNNTQFLSLVRTSYHFLSSCYHLSWSCR